MKFSTALPVIKLIHILVHRGGCFNSGRENERCFVPVASREHPHCNEDGEGCYCGRVFHDFDCSYRDIWSMLRNAVVVNCSEYEFAFIYKLISIFLSECSFLTLKSKNQQDIKKDIFKKFKKLNYLILLTVWRPTSSPKSKSDLNFEYLLTLMM